jgi:lipopolysaccharide biosynthesis regulator YciM
LTATLAELYVKQGLIGRAREIYERLAASPDPAVAEAARRRLQELPQAKGEIALLQELLERVRSRR